MLVRFLLEACKVEFSEDEQGIVLCYVHQKKVKCINCEDSKRRLIIPCEIEEIAKIT